jgi:hypothetical protein
VHKIKKMNSWELRKYTGCDYYSTKDQLLENTHDPKYIISTEYYNDRLEKSCRLFTSVDTTTQLFSKFYQKLEPHVRCFYEVVPGEKLSKMRFDIEKVCDSLEERIEYEHKLLRCILRAIAKTSPELVDEDKYLSTVRVYESHRETKVSYHVVILNMVGTNLALKEYYSQVLDNIREKYQPYIDRAVYSSFQQFRLFGSTKYGKIANKKLWKGRMDFGRGYFENPGEPRNRIEAIQVFQESLLQFLPAKYTILREVKAKSKHIDDSFRLADLEISKSDLQATLSEWGNLKVGSEQGNIINVSNKGGYNCPICKREHEHENPYLAVQEDKVLFFCRRHDSGKPKTVYEKPEEEIEIKETKVTKVVETVTKRVVKSVKKKKFQFSQLTETAFYKKELKFRYQ